jgi:hypothetical protein
VASLLKSIGSVQFACIDSAYDKVDFGERQIVVIAALWPPGRRQELINRRFSKALQQPAYGAFDGLRILRVCQAPGSDWRAFAKNLQPLMSGETDRLAFDTASKPGAASSAEFAAIAKMAAGVDTLEGFLREMKARFPDAVAKAMLPAETAKPDPVSTGSLQRIIGLTRADAAT